MQKTINERSRPDSSDYEMTLSVGGVQRKVFFQGGFFRNADATAGESLPHVITPLHRHSYPEIHLFVGEGGRVMLEDETMTPGSGVAIAIPGRTYHALELPSETMHCAFQLDTPMQEIRQAALPIDLLRRFMEEIGECTTASDLAGLERYIAFISSYFVSPMPQKVKKTTDYPFVIHEFMSHSYHLNLRLGDLAERLHVTERQTARLLVKHTGRNFNDELTHYRISAAERLMRMNPSLPMSTVAALVGYQSQSGFWKAYKRYQSSPKEKDKR